MTDQSAPTFHFEWNVELQSAPEELWTYVADTDRLNHDIGFSEIRRVETGQVINNRKTAQQSVMGITQQWTEDPFQWTYPIHYNTVRNYSRGFFDTIRQRLDMHRQENGNTRLNYQIDVTPRYPLLGFFIRRSFENMPFEAVFRRYDEIIQKEETKPVAVFDADAPVTVADKTRLRLQQLQQELIDAGARPAAVVRLIDYVTQADDLSLMNIKPYALADAWDIPRQDLLETCLYATRAGLLNMSWDLLCPLCRNRKSSTDTLQNISQTVHCDVCHIDYNANFEQSVELTFKPNPSIRQVEGVEYCVGGPEVTPHIYAQQLLAPGEQRQISGETEPGRYRVRTMTQDGGQYVRVVAGGGVAALVIKAATLNDWQQNEAFIAQLANITLYNDTDAEKLFVIERLQWSDQAVTAAEVTTRQVFRDLFASEALRPNEKVSIGKLTIVFTDLRGSTAMYQSVGDAPAFGLVMQHFDVLRETVRAHNGGIVKTIGDAIMAVFQEPGDAVQAMLEAQQRIANGTNTRSLALRVGIHTGSCIAVTLNERLDYFGTAVNMAARLESKSDGNDIILSDAVYNDPGVTDLLRDLPVTLTPFEQPLRGLGTEKHQLWRVQPAAQA